MTTVFSPLSNILLCADVGDSATFHLGASVRRPPCGLFALLGTVSTSEFWSCVQEWAEHHIPPLLTRRGAQRSPRGSGLLSNELGFTSLAWRLSNEIPAGRAYVGVGCEQNFHFIAAVKPAKAYVLDLNPAVVTLHILYKAVFALSPTRSAFLACLFSRQPANLSPSASVGALIGRLVGAQCEEAIRRKNADSIIAYLRETGGQKYVALHEQRIRDLHHVFAEAGAFMSIRGLPATEPPRATFASLMTATDARGVHRSFLADEHSYTAIRNLQLAHRILPLHGDIAGEKCMKQVAAEVTRAGQVVGAFYTSNAEQLLAINPASWSNYTSNVLALPHDSASRIARSGDIPQFGFRSGTQAFFQQQFSD